MRLLHTPAIAMPTFTIYHNPKCGTSRNVLALIQNDRRLRCYGQGGEKIDKKTYKPYEGYGDMVYISASSNEDRPPQMIRADGTICDNLNTMERQALARKLYGGCFVNIAVRVWPQDNQFGRRINGVLQGVMFASDGTPVGGGR